MSFVLDNSVTMRWYFGDGKSSDLTYASTILDAIKKKRAYVPSIWGLEVADVLAMAEAKELTTPAVTEGFITLLKSLRIVADDATFEHSLSNTLQIARRYNLSSYDASYLELAMRLNMPLATLDEELIKAAKKSGVQRL